MIDKNKILSIPMEEKEFMDPRVRSRFFMDLIQNYKERCPNLSLKYAYLNTDATLPIDYLLLFQTKNIDNTMDLIVFDLPLLYNDRSLPGYRYCKRLKIEDDFFKESVGSMVSISLVRFNEYINMILNLSVDSGNENYWKRAEYSKVVAKGMLDLALRYNKRQ